MTIAHLLGLTICLAVPAALHAQVPDTMLQGEEITEQALVRALTPHKMRNFVRDGVKPKPPQASLLITFQTDSTKLTPDAQRSLDVVGRALNSNDLGKLKFLIEGHADPRGDNQYNLQLSQGRADSVVSYLSRTFNIERERLVPVGKGDTDVLNKTQPDAPENRRVTIKTLVK